MGFNMVRGVAVAFAMRQLRRKRTYSAAAQAQRERAWNDGLEMAAVCFVIAKHCTCRTPTKRCSWLRVHVLFHEVSNASQIDAQPPVAASRRLSRARLLIQNGREPFEQEATR